MEGSADPAGSSPVSTESDEVGLADSFVEASEAPEGEQLDLESASNPESLPVYEGLELFSQTAMASKGEDPEPEVTSLELREFENGEWSNGTEIEEGDAVRVYGTVIDSETGNGISTDVTVKIDFNFDGDFDDPNETWIVTSNSSGEFYAPPTPHSLAIPDDGPSPGNGTTSDQIQFEAVPKQYVDTGQGKKTATDTVKNVDPVLDDESLSVSFDWDNYGISFTGATVSGSFSDPGVPDVHTVKITFGNGASKTAVVTGNSFSINTPFSAGAVLKLTDYERMFPITVDVDDDDMGTDQGQIDHSCGPRAGQPFPDLVSHVAGRGTFADYRSTPQVSRPGVTLKHWDPTNGTSPDQNVGATLELIWGARKPAFFGSGQCNVGIIQIAKVVSDYEGPTSLITEAVNNKDWHIDSSIPYPHGLLPYETSDETFSIGVVGMTDSPGLPTKAGPNHLVSGGQYFESCVVALPSGAEFELGQTQNSEYLKKMAIYGCVTWSYEADLVAGSTNNNIYTVKRTLQGVSQVDSQVNVAPGAETFGPDITYSGVGIAPSGTFIEEVENYYLFPIV